jgi:hypothetical protein
MAHEGVQFPGRITVDELVGKQYGEDQAAEKKGRSGSVLGWKRFTLFLFPIQPEGRKTVGRGCATSSNDRREARRESEGVRWLNGQAEPTKD